MKNNPKIMHIFDGKNPKVGDVQLLHYYTMVLPVGKRRVELSQHHPVTLSISEGLPPLRHQVVMHRALLFTGKQLHGTLGGSVDGEDLVSPPLEHQGELLLQTVVTVRGSLLEEDKVLPRLNVLAEDCVPQILAGGEADDFHGAVLHDPKT